jgi:hypothetical protein
LVGEASKTVATLIFLFEGVDKHSDEKLVFVTDAGRNCLHSKRVPTFFGRGSKQTRSATGEDKAAIVVHGPGVPEILKRIVTREVHMLYLFEVYALVGIVISGLAFGAFLVFCAAMRAGMFITRLLQANYAPKHSHAENWR